MKIRLHSINNTSLCEEGIAIKWTLMGEFGDAEIDLSLELFDRAVELIQMNYPEKNGLKYDEWVNMNIGYMIGTLGWYNQVEKYILQEFYPRGFYIVCHDVTPE